MSPKLDQPKSDLFNYFTDAEQWSDIVAALKLGAREFCFFFLSTPAYMNSPLLFVLFLPSSAYFNSSLWFMSVQISLQISRRLGSLSVMVFNEIILSLEKDWLIDWLIGNVGGSSDDWMKMMYFTFHLGKLWCHKGHYVHIFYSVYRQ